MILLEKTTYELWADILEYGIVGEMALPKHNSGLLILLTRA